MSSTSPTRVLLATLTTVVVALTFLVVAGGTSAVAAPSRTGTDAASRLAAWTPPTGPAFNDPQGSRADRKRLMQRLLDLTTHAPAGSAIRIATFYLNRDDMTQALLDAAARGVQVRIIVSSVSGETPQVQRLVAALGTDAAQPSYVVRCSGSCFRWLGLVHSKLYLFSASGTASNVTVISSANIDNTQADTRWNNSFTTVDPTAYAQHRRLFDAMRFDKQGEPPTSPFTSAGVTYWFGPSARDPYADVLDQVGCDAGPGAGVNGHTIVDVSSSLWSVDTIDLAQRLVELRAAGCRVGVLLRPSATDPAVQQTLLDGGVAVRASNGRNPSLGVHTKAIMVDGRVGADPSVKTVVAGSLNFSAHAIEKCDNNTFRVLDDAAVFSAYDGSFRQAWTANGVKLTKVAGHARMATLSPAQLEALDG